MMDSNKEYFKAIMTGKKKFLYSKDVNVIKLPQLKSLSIKDILVFTKKNTDIENYLPIYKYYKLPNIEWLWNVINSIGGVMFKKFIQNALDKREKEMILSKGLNVTAIPEIANIFAASKNISYCNGGAHYLLRTKPINNKKTSWNGSWHNRRDKEGKQ